MRHLNRTGIVVALLAVLLGLPLLKLPAYAQIDPSGEWAPLLYEDGPDRMQGPEIGDYLGFPLNDAARLRADSWEGSLKELQVNQCLPHSSDFEWRSPFAVRIWPEFDRKTQELLAYHTHALAYGNEQTIWMDGRPRPPSYARYSWQGFSTGHFEGDILVVLTDHLKENEMSLTEIPRSSLATVTAHLSKHGDYLTVSVIVYDPVYLTEPFMRSSDFASAPQQRIAPWPCEPVEEVNTEPGRVPNHLPGTNTYLTEFPAEHGIPPEAARGGAETMYPQYMDKVKTMKLLPRPAKPAAGQ